MSKSSSSYGAIAVNDDNNDDELLNSKANSSLRSRAESLVEAFSPPKADGATVLQTTINVVKVCIGTGVLALPFTFAQGGILSSIVILLVVAKWNILSVNMLLDCEQYVLRLESISRRMRGVHLRDEPVSNESPMSKISRYALGSAGVLLTESSIGIVSLVSRERVSIYLARIIPQV